MNQRLLKVPEIAEMTGKSPNTIRWYRARQTAGMPDGPRLFKVGRHVVAKEADVVAWIENQYEAAAVSAN